MGLASRSQPSSMVLAKPAPRQPDYKAEENSITVSVWEDNRNGEYFYTIRCQRSYLDGRGKTNFTDSFEHEHLDTLIRLIRKANADIESEIQSRDSKQLEIDKAM